MLHRFRAAAVAALLGLTTAAAAQPTLYVGNGRGNYQTNVYGGVEWDNMTGVLSSTFAGTITQHADLSDLPTLLAHDRLWLDQRLNDVLSATELANVAAFLATGRRAVLIGENSSWDGGWNEQILTLVGGALGADGCFFANTNTALAHPITAGVGTVHVPCAHEIAGGAQLFDFPFAALWGPSQSILTIFDANLMDDTYWANADNALFAENVAAWLAGGGVAAVPEPATVALVGGGLLALVVVGRRRTGAGGR